MASDKTPTHSGGCQCGRIRFHAYAEPAALSICHCRMCQKATGSPFGAFASFDRAAVEFVKAKPEVFKSSELAERGFCSECGTPLTFSANDRDRIGLLIATFDHPGRLTPKRQIGMESRLPWLDEALRLPGKSTEELNGPERMTHLASRQHPDHD